jgi:hypothetical protein
MQILYERCAAVDVGKDVIAIPARLPGRRPGWPGDRQADVQDVWRRPRLLHAVYHALIEHGNFEKVLVCNAAYVKNVPDRKTDLADAEWLAHLPPREENRAGRDSGGSAAGAVTKRCA